LFCFSNDKTSKLIKFKTYKLDKTLLRVINDFVPYSLLFQNRWMDGFGGMVDEQIKINVNNKVD